MNVAGVEIDVRHPNTQRFLQGRQRAMNAGGRFPVRVHSTCFLLAIQQQELPLLVVCHAIDRPLASQSCIACAANSGPLSERRYSGVP